MLTTHLINVKIFIFIVNLYRSSVDHNNNNNLKIKVDGNLVQAKLYADRANCENRCSQQIREKRDQNCINDIFNIKLDLFYQHMVRIRSIYNSGNDRLIKYCLKLSVL